MIRVAHPASLDHARRAMLALLVQAHRAAVASAALLRALEPTLTVLEAGTIQ